MILVLFLVSGFVGKLEVGFEFFVVLKFLARIVVVGSECLEEVILFKMEFMGSF